MLLHKPRIINKMSFQIIVSSSLAPTYPASSLDLQLEGVEQGRVLNLESLM